ncbi:helicase-exonuclease AddAB subunit AddA [Tenuibacillus multivorans]|uniref:ATP-dependent helicase/nuclease subunit A n=1 Tax=Tenuibacillus multivorans TaxID=237069 RepID=A0A1H0A2G9_9BACI|nr:helicase-exonuclease AddAB subunit AddA [Tenuibacillus multivorans]GEL78361.1 ATP-dependent helicase/nuclease subunit A [Tenuibacillus multivorans]SDN27401.1 DNA helicase/exodeoxyribonuclease V, subunit A [Tenuibacillus multivorans]
MKWTEEQELAIYEGEKDILVAAAAGSGKTAVLVERIIQKMLREHDPYNIDEMLVVTFTNAAAQEMRTRVGAAIEKALQTNPNSIHLKKQLSLLQHANISTLHSFCMEVVRKYSYQLDLDPSFRILDDIEAELLRSDIIQEVFEEWYGKEGEEQETFFRFVDSFSNDRDDAKVETLVLKMYEFAMQNPWPYEWLNQVQETYRLPEDAKLDDLPWMPIVREDIKENLEAMLFDMNQALDIAQDVNGPAHYVPTLEEDRAQIKQVMESTGAPWYDLRQIFIDNEKFGSLSRKKIECDEDLKEAVKEIRNRYKDRMKKLIERWFKRAPKSLVEDLHKLSPLIDQLVVLVKEFHERFQQAKKEQAMVDFSDLEHYCLEILLDDEATADHLVGSTVASQFQHQFKEVLIDEYQDTNLVQETILQLVTQGEQAGNLFMVGDVKQSIYRFRHAEPTLFMNKYKNFKQADAPSLRIDLARNFRSRKEVLDSTNYIFRQLLDEQVGEMTYDKDAELIYSNQVYEQLTTSDVDTELHVITQDDIEDENISDEWKYIQKAQLEARAYAEKIKKWIGTDSSNPMQVIDKETEQIRSLQYRDIVILMRSMSWASVIVEELKQLGIPVYADISSGYLEAMEVQIMLNVLKTIDNPQQDIPLVSVLKSPIVGLSEDDLANIRLHGKNQPFYVAMKKYIKQGEKAEVVRPLTAFVETFESWREEARYGALSKLIWQIYRDTGYFEFVGGTPGGKQRQANLRALYDRARSYETSSYRGLYRFLRFIERMEERGEDLAAARALGEQEDVVRMMTIHKSKGLEFPVVILGAADKGFNEMDFRSQYLLHKDHGFGAKYMDVDKRLLFTTFPFEAIKVAMKREMLAEEMRILYVALTRAKEKLTVVGTVKDWEKRLAKWNEVTSHLEWVLPPHIRTDQATYLNWIGTALIRHEQAEKLQVNGVASTVPTEIRQDESRWNIKVQHASELMDPEWITVKRNDELEQVIKKWDETHLQDKSGDYEEVDRRLTFVYPNKSSATRRAKQTVTELKRLRQVPDDYSSMDLMNKQPKMRFQRPRFMQKDAKKLTATEVGSAMHTVMQHLPMNREWTKVSLVEFVDGLVLKEILREEESEVIDYDAILTFLSNRIGHHLHQAVEVRRELPFTMELAASEVYPDWNDPGDESVIIQGVIDCLFKTEEGWYLLDYKTDSIFGKLTDEKVNELKDRYAVQVELYQRAVENIWNIQLQKVYLYFFERDLILEN